MSNWVVITALIFSACLNARVNGSVAEPYLSVKDAPNPSEIVAQAANAARAIPSMSYEATYESASPGQSNRALSAKGTVELERDSSLPPQLPAKLRVKSEGPGGLQEVTFDGKVARRLMHERKVLTEGLADKGGLGVARNSAALLLLIWDLIGSEPLKHERGAVQSRYIGLGAVAGVVCHVVELTYQVPGTEIQGAWWWFAVDDKLPRRYQKFSRNADGTTTIAELTMFNLRVGDGMAESKFDLPLPEGYSYQHFVPGPKPKPVALGQLAPKWTLADSSGRMRSLSDYRGKVVVMNFWASWCGYSKLGIPALDGIRKKYEERGVKVFGISFQELEGVNPTTYLQQRGVGFENLLHGEKIAEIYSVSAVPAYYVVDQEGKVAFAALAYQPDIGVLLDDAILRLLKNQ